MQKIISIILIAALIVCGGCLWRLWLPAAAEFTLQQERGQTSKEWTLLLLRRTDPVLDSIGRYLGKEFTEQTEEFFLYFPKEEPKDVQEDHIEATNLSALSGTYKQENGTAVANATSYSVENYLDRAPSLPAFEQEGPAILLYHTHTTECYRNSQGITNTTDESQNVVAVGKAMKKIFEDAGYQTIHLTEQMNEDFSNAYPTARARVQEILKQNPSIKVVLDVHRDSISSGGIQYYPVTTVNGKEAAQIMIVCGTEEKGMSHPNWDENFTYALALSRKMGSLYGQLSRPVNLRGDRFNTHFTPHTLLLEVGSSANTLEQAIYGGELCAKAMIALWNGS